MTAETLSTACSEVRRAKDVVILFILCKGKVDCVFVVYISMTGVPVVKYCICITILKRICVQFVFMCACVRACVCEGILVYGLMGHPDSSTAPKATVSH